MFANRTSFFTALVAACALIAGPAGAQDLDDPSLAQSSGMTPSSRVFGFGLQVGAPSAVTVKAMVTRNSGLIVGLGGGAPYLFGPTLSLHADYVVHPGQLAASDEYALSWYIGAGGLAAIAPFETAGGPPHPVLGYRYYTPGVMGTSFAARIPVGLSLALHDLPVELYGGLVPNVLVFPSVGFGLGGSAGVRLYL